MNAFDFVVAGIIAAGAVYGIRQGLLTMVTSVAALIAAFYLASTYYPQAGEVVQHQLGTSPTLSAVAGYLLVFLAVFIGVQFIGATIVRFLQQVSLGWADRLAGGLVGGGIAAAIAGLIVMLLTAVLPADAALLRDSQAAPMLLAYNAALARYVPEEARQAYERNRAALMRYWIAEAANAMTRSGSPSASPSPTPGVKK